jgi:hypothetical protein
MTSAQSGGEPVGIIAKDVIEGGQIERCRLVQQLIVDMVAINVLRLRCLVHHSARGQVELVVVVEQTVDEIIVGLLGSLFHRIHVIANIVVTRIVDAHKRPCRHQRDFRAKDVAQCTVGVR